MANISCVGRLTLDFHRERASEREREGGEEERENDFFFIFLKYFIIYEGNGVSNS